MSDKLPPVPKRRPNPDLHNFIYRGRNHPKPTLPDPHVPLSRGIPLWLGIVFVVMVAAPLVIAILTSTK